MKMAAKECVDPESDAKHIEPSYPLPALSAMTAFSALFLKGWWTTVRNTNLFADDVAVDPADHYLGSKQCQGERNYH
jgi:hypothetical protein